MTDEVIKISQLAELTDPALTDYLVINRHGTPKITRRVRIDLVSELLKQSPIPANTEVLSADRSLTDADAVIQYLDPGGAARDVPLPTPASTNHPFVISNRADADETLTVYDGATAVDTVGEGETKMFFSDGSAWAGLSGGGGGGGGGDASADGWNADANAWTFSSVDNPTGVFTIAANATTYLSLGMRIKMTNGGNTIYGIITKLAYAAPNTTVTFLHEVNPANNQALYLMANSAITNPHYSSVKVPFGFPVDQRKWTVLLRDTTQYAQATPTALQYYNLGSLNLTIPLGLWNVTFAAYPVVTAASETRHTYHCTLSTANNNVSDEDFTARADLVILASNQCGFSFEKNKTIDLASKTVYYVLLMDRTAGASNIYVGVQPTIVGLFVRICKPK